MHPPVPTGCSESRTDRRPLKRWRIRSAPCTPLRGAKLASGPCGRASRVQGTFRARPDPAHAPAAIHQTADALPRASQVRLHDERNDWCHAYFDRLRSVMPVSDCQTPEISRRGHGELDGRIGTDTVNHHRWRVLANAPSKKVPDPHNLVRAGRHPPSPAT